MRKLLLAFFYLLTALPVHAEALPRTLIALYDSREESSPRSTLIHRYLEMPANYLGYDMAYYDINGPLPEPDAGVRGVVIWFNSGMEVPDAERYLDWLDAATAGGRKLVVMENFGLGDRWRRDPALMDKAARVLARIGVKDTNRWQSLTYEVRIAYADRMLTGFERAYEASMPPYMDTRATGEGVSHLRLSLQQGRDTANSDLIITGPHGAYAAAGYALYRVVENNETKLHQWYIDPFAFLSMALEAEALPKPDVATLDGERIFYASLDGDGWNDLSAIPAYNRMQASSAQVVQKEIIETYPGLPFTVGLVGAELDASCYGLKSSAKVARSMLALPNVEAASHTMTHPLYWRFFADYAPEKEAPFRKLYPSRPRDQSSLIYALMDRWFDRWKSWTGESTHYAVPPPGRYDLPEEATLRKYYRIPRAYACAPFDLRQEITGSVEQAQRLLPAGKRVRLLNWTGDTSPFEAAIAATREAGLLNLGGGDARQHADYPSYASVPPVGLHVGSETQLYGDNGNEWGLLGGAGGENAAGLGVFRLETQMSGTPLRLKPFSIYAHIYAGRAAADLHVLKEALADAEAEELIPLFASDYAAIAAGFYTTRIEPQGTDSWRISGRGALSTLRFDHASLKAVDFARSSGVLGMRWSQGSLYVALDPDAEAPVVALKPVEILGEYPAAPRPYLIASHWQIKGLQMNNNSLIFQAQGYGGGIMQWRMQAPGSYRIVLSHDGKILGEQIASAPEGLLSIKLESVGAGTPLTVSIETGS
ncbi:MAG: hypothetical protein JO089_06420 [Alphaproteobacteria bacterium]|nr:hypothetical protein [Alphaproteobacteria bacterium]